MKTKTRVQYFEFEINTCPACGEQETVSITEPTIWESIKGWWRVAECPDCGKRWNSKAE